MALRDDTAGGAVRTAEAGNQRTFKVRPSEIARRTEQRISAPKDDAQDAFDQAQKLYDKGEYVESWAVVDRALTHGEQDNPKFLLLAAQINDKAKRHAISYQFAKRVTELAPQAPIGWLNLGYSLEQLFLLDESEKAYQRGLSVAHTDEQKGTLRLNWASLMITRGDFEAAEQMARQALKYTPNSKKARANLGFALLAQRKWREGWPLYNAIVGYHDSRLKRQYTNEPTWTGKPGQKIVVYGEQGLGDEISFASMYPDAIARAGRVIVECEPRLAGLFARSFPAAKVYGTLREKASSWAAEDTKIDASITSAGLGELFRNDDADFPGTPYLVPDPDRVDMWRGLFAKQGKPVIGVAWSGGVFHTGDRFRQISLEQLLPLFRSVDAVWISLQYKDAGSEISVFRDKYRDIDLRQYAFGTLTDDYDDTAALVKALDKVVSMQTAVIHLAGAMGVPTHCFVSKGGQWRYGQDATDMLWYRSVVLHRQHTPGVWPVAEVAGCLS